ncbi:hypothetical protein NE237_027817 [Protea cynaroides]|uniref:U1-type domain-containing protein n=1 Tax=Protea cynaroides TaxID=273540 RepID=A0A9Q0GP36_9MAGN|nr:hypothetical protein NE237_027817 [Protea cynaroides]
MEHAERNSLNGYDWSFCVLPVPLTRFFLGGGGRLPYRGGGRSGRPFRGGGQGNFGSRHSRPDGSGPLFRNRGRMGRGGGRRYPPRVAASTSHLAATSDQEAAALEEGEEKPPAIDLGEASTQVQGLPTPVPAPGQAAPTRCPPQIAWCELCRVDCTSLEILEQHKNGKRHKKNLQRFGELQNAGEMIQKHKPVSATQVEQKPDPALPSEEKPVAEVQNGQEPTQEKENELGSVPETKSEVTAEPENVQNENKSTADNLHSEVPTAENKMDTRLLNNSDEQFEITKVEQTEAPARSPRMDIFNSRRRGLKRKMRGGRGGKRLRMSEQPRRPVEPPKPKEVVPLICDLCNVKCDTQAVLDCHLVGRKHLSKLKRFQGHQAMYGASGLQSLYPPNPSAQSTFFIPQGHPQGYYGPHGSFPLMASYGFPQAQQAATAAGHAHQAAIAAGQVHQAATAADGQAPLAATAAAGQAQQAETAAGLAQQAETAAGLAQQAETAAGGSEQQVQQSEPHESHVMLDPVLQNAAAVELDGQKGTYAMKAEDQQATSVESKSEYSISVSEVKDFGPAMGNLVAPPSVNTVMEADKVLPATDDPGPAPEY